MVSNCPYFSSSSGGIVSISVSDPSGSSISKGRGGFLSGDGPPYCGGLLSSESAMTVPFTFVLFRPCLGAL